MKSMMIWATAKDRKYKTADKVKLFKPGRSFKVLSLDYGHKASKQLIDMGITPDTLITIESAAPLGEPLVVKVRDYKIALRSNDLLALEVKQLEHAG